MRFFQQFFICMAINSAVKCFFINSVYPQFKLFHDNKDPSESLYLTKYIENGDIETARYLALVNHSEINIPNYAGYFTVNKEYNSNLFFWYFSAKNNSENAPIILWLQGGPGSSSLIGNFYENGPYEFFGSKLIPRKYSWHLNHHLIYIDNPVGSGFSFTDSDDGYAKNEEDVGQNLLSALQQFFLLFPNLQKNEFFIAGESYAGKYIPAIGYAILKESQHNNFNDLKPKINLKGLAVGNGFSDPINQLNYADYLYQLGLIDTNGREEFLKYQNKGIECIKKEDFICAYEIFDKLMEFKTDKEPSLFQNLTGFNTYFNFLNTQNINKSSMNEFLQKSETKRALHVGNNIFHIYNDENIVENHLKEDIYKSVAEWISELLSHYSILIYSGQLDIIVAYPMTENFLEKLNFNGTEEYKTAKRYIWRVDNEVAGYVKNAGNLTEVLVRNAGHLVPTDQPKWTLDMILRFTHYRGFE